MKGYIARIKNLLHRYSTISTRDDWNGYKKVFITSTGRTGTKFFEDFFNKNYNSVYALHEPIPDLFKVSVDAIRNKHSPEKVINAIHSARGYCLKDMLSNNAELYLESNWNIAYLLPYLEDVFGENCYVIHIIRDPKTYVVSGMNKYPLFDDADKRNRLNSLDFPEDYYAEEGYKYNRFEKICWHWYKINSIMKKYVEQNDRAITIKFEDIFFKQNDYVGLKSLIDFLELKEFQKVEDFQLMQSFSTKVNRSQSKEFVKPYPFDTDVQKQSFHRITDELAKYYGY